MVETKILGSLYLDGQPVEPRLICGKSTAISLGDTVPGKELKWLHVHGLLVAYGCVCSNIKWTTLNRMGYIFGRPVWIDGQPYMCRSLGAGPDKDCPSEWDAILNELGIGDEMVRDNEFINAVDPQYHEEYDFWTQEIYESERKYCTIRGGMGFPRLRRECSATHCSIGTGFRPVLEPMHTAPPETLVGSSVRFYGPHGETLTGVLVDFDDYDLVVAGASAVPRSWAWANKKGKEVLLRRSEIIATQKIG